MDSMKEKCRHTFTFSKLKTILIAGLIATKIVHEQKTSTRQQRFTTIIRRTIYNLSSSISDNRAKNDCTRSSVTASKVFGCHFGFWSLSISIARTPSLKSLFCKWRKTIRYSMFKQRGSDSLAPNSNCRWVTFNDVGDILLRVWKANRERRRKKLILTLRGSLGNLIVSSRLYIRYCKKY